MVATAQVTPYSARPAATCSGVVLYADASQPSPSRATRRSPAADPQLPIQIGGRPEVGRGSSAVVSPSESRPRWTRSSRTAASNRGHRSSNSTPASA